MIWIVLHAVWSICAISLLFTYRNRIKSWLDALEVVLLCLGWPFYMLIFLMLLVTDFFEEL
jgi:hypothetical protein